jgi:hypothetical protein
VVAGLLAELLASMFLGLFGIGATRHCIAPSAGGDAKLAVRAANQPGLSPACTGGLLCLAPLRGKRSGAGTGVGDSRRPIRS